MVETGDTEASQQLDVKRFFSAFCKAKGALSTVIISISLSFAMGCTVGIVPEILSGRYAILHHGYQGEVSCSSFDDESMPAACRHGADDAQDGSAWSSMLQNLLTLFFNPVVGSLSDLHGRRWVFLMSTFLYTLAPIVLVLMQLFPSTDPGCYYLANSLIGGISYMGIAFAVLSDTIPEEFRAPSFGVVMAAFYGGFALSPFLALFLSHLRVSILSAVLTIAAFVYAFVFFPETLPESVRNSNREVQLQRQEGQEDETRLVRKVSDGLVRPFKEMKILGRDTAMRLVAIGSFFSSMVYSTDHNLVIFYIEEHLNVRESDIARMFLVMGVVGVIFQAVLLQPLIKFFGEKGLLIVSFLSGTFHNFLYGVAKNKQTIYLALCFSQLTKTNFPILASLASKGATENEQGQVQGALYAVNALSAAIGPLSMQFIYERTKDSLGPGTMFVFAAFLYLIGTFVVSFIPVHKPTHRPQESSPMLENLAEPLLTTLDDTPKITEK